MEEGWALPPLIGDSLCDVCTPHGDLHVQLELPALAAYDAVGGGEQPAGVEDGGAAPVDGRPLPAEEGGARVEARSTGLDAVVRRCGVGGGGGGGQEDQGEGEEPMKLCSKRNCFSGMRFEQK